MICLHKWSKWEIYSKGDINLNYKENGVIKQSSLLGMFIIQKKECEKCGKIKLREEKTDYYGVDIEIEIEGK